MPDRGAAVDEVLGARGWTAVVIPARRDPVRTAQVAGRPVLVEGDGDAVVIVRSGEPPVLLVSSGCRWPTDPGRLEVRIADHPGAALAELLGGGPVGVTGLDPAAPLELGLAAAGVRLDRADSAVDALREIKDPEALADAEHAAHLADRCFEGVLSDLWPGTTEAQMAGRLTGQALAMGAGDVEIVVHRWSPEHRLTSDRPGTQGMSVGSMVLCSLTVSGPRGHRATLARPIAFGALDEPSEVAARGAGAALVAVARRATPGTSIGELTEVARLAALAEEAELLSAVIHGTGRLPVEAPTGTSARLRTGHLLTVECACAAGGAAALMTDTLIMERAVARRLGGTAVGVFAPEFHRRSAGPGPEPASHRSG